MLASVYKTIRIVAILTAGLFHADTERFKCINVFKPHDNAMEWGLLSLPFYGWENKGLGRLETKTRYEKSTGVQGTGPSFLILITEVPLLLSTDFQGWDSVGSTPPGPHPYILRNVKLYISHLTHVFIKISSLFYYESQVNTLGEYQRPTWYYV